MQINEIVVAFWVEAKQWPPLGDWLAAHAADSSVGEQVQTLTTRLSSSQPRVLLDGTSFSGMYLGQLVFAQGEFLAHAEVRPKAVAVLWNLQDFLLEFILDEDALSDCSEQQRRVLIGGFSGYLQAFLAESLGPVATYVGMVHAFVDADLLDVKENSGVEQYVSQCFGGRAEPTDVYWSQSAAPSLFLWTPQTLSQPAHVLVSANANELRRQLVEVEHLLEHEVLHRAMEREIEAAEREATRALALRERLSALSTSGPSVVSLLLSSRAKSYDLLAELGGSIVDLNEAAQRLQDRRASLSEIRMVYDDDLLWGSQGLVLLRTWVARGKLIKVSQDDIGTISLASYMRRNGLQILAFYDQRLVETHDRLQGLLASARTLLDVRTTQQSELLNRLVLALTLVTIVLALLQVISAFDWWQDWGGVLLLVGIMLILFPLGFLAVRKSVKPPPTEKAQKTNAPR